MDILKGFKPTTDKPVKSVGSAEQKSHWLTLMRAVFKTDI